MQGCLVTVHRTTGSSHRGICEAFTRAGIVLTNAKVEASGGFVELTSQRVLISAEQIDWVGVEAEGIGS